MRRTVFLLACVLLAGLGRPTFVRAGDGERELPSKVLAVFSAKCARCHGPNVRKPKGRFGYVLDLARMARNREMIVPSSPEESDLWDLVRRNEMPPADSPTGPLSMAQKEVIRAWIAAGAPAPASVKPGANPQRSEGQANVPVPASMGHILRKLGAFHVVIVHFPIALLLTAAMAELWSQGRGQRTPTSPVRFCVLLGAAGALAAAALGWLQAANGYGLSMPKTLGLHRWLGMAAAVCSVGAALLGEWDERCGRRSIRFRAALFVAAVLVGVTGHFGGILVHGDGYFTGD